MIGMSFEVKSLVYSVGDVGDERQAWKDSFSRTDWSVCLFDTRNSSFSSSATLLSLRERYP